MDTTPGILGLCITRWTVKWAALNAITSNYSALLELFEESFMEETVSDMKARINGVRYQMMEFDFFFGVNLAKLILLHTDNLARALQKPELCVSQAKELYKGVAATLEGIKFNDFEEFWKETFEKSKELEINQPKLPRKRKTPARYFPKENNENSPTTAKDYYKGIFIQSFDVVLECLKDRFEQDGLEKYSNMQDLLLLAAKKENYDNELKKFIEFYHEDVDVDLLKGQLKTFSKIFTAKENINFEDIMSYFKQLGPGVKSLLSEVGKVMKLVLVLGASNATSERAFSRLRLISTYLRATMSQQRLNHFMILGIYPELVDSLDSTDIIEKFIKGVTRREHLFGKTKEQ